MFKNFITLFCFFFIKINGFSQNIVSGKVIDQHTKQAIESAVITTAKNEQTTITDVMGYFKIMLPSDANIINISMIGYRSIIDTISFQNNIIIYLQRGLVDLKEIIITPQNNNASFHNISAIDLNMRPVNSSQDLMRLVPGLFLGQHQGGGIAEHIFFRGFDADHGTDVNVSVDGMPINLVSHAHGQGFADLHFLIPELVNKYEYGKGPYYTEHGDFTTAGYVAFKTFDVLDKNMVKIEGGQFNTGRAMAMVNLLSDKNKQQGESAYIAGETAYTNGPFDWAQHFKRINLFGKYVVNINAKNKLGITLATFKSSWHSSGEIPERAIAEEVTDRFGYIDSAQGGATNRTNAILKLTSILSDNLVFENQIYYSKYFFNLNYDATFFAVDSLNGDQLRQRENRSLAGYNGKLTHRDYFTSGTTLISVTGVGAQYNNIQNSELSRTIHQTTVLDFIQLGNIKESALNAYFDENLQMGKWLFNAGARIDYLNFIYENKLATQQPARHKYIVSPKFNIEYTSNKTLQFYLKTGKGFHSNDAKVVAINNGREILPAAYGADIGINWKPIPHLYITTAIWYLQLQEEFTYNADEGTTGPGDRTRRQGVDVSARYQFTKWLFASMDVNISKARSLDAPKGSNYLALAVPLSSTGGLDFKFANGINGGLSYRYMKDRPATEDNTLIAKGYFVSDLTINYTSKKYEIGLAIQNLFNTKWREAQFEVQSRLRNEPAPVDDISFTAGTPFFAKVKCAVFF